MSRTRIKICGLTRAEDIQAVVAAGADAIGFVFYPKSPRYVTPRQAACSLQRPTTFTDSATRLRPVAQLTSDRRRPP